MVLGQTHWSCELSEAVFASKRLEFSTFASRCGYLFGKMLVASETGTPNGGFGFRQMLCIHLGDFFSTIFLLIPRSLGRWSNLTNAHIFSHWAVKNHQLHSGKLAWQWKIHIFNRKYIFKGFIFHCYVTCICVQLLEGSPEFLGEISFGTGFSRHNVVRNVPQVRIDSGAPWWG